ncbi:MAG: VOC family protein [Actinomycetota bacterium]
MTATTSPETHIGHVHLKVTDLERSVEFYTNVLGFELTTRYGSEAAFMSYGGYHHHLGLNTWHSKGAGPAPVRAAGLFHFAILYPTRKDLAMALRRVLESGWGLDGASDHGVSQALYLHDPDNNGIELYWDRPRDQWEYRPDGELVMVTEPLDLDDLLAQAA